MSYNSDELDALREMASTAGWQIVRRLVDQRVQAATRALVDASPTDPAKIATLQAEIRQLPAVVRHVDNVLSKVDTEEFTHE